MNLYKNTFRFYDLIATDFDNDDLKFYENFLRSKNSKVLEVGCGTGRVSIWLGKPSRDKTLLACFIAYE